MTKIDGMSLVTGFVLVTVDDWISTSAAYNNKTWSDLVTITEIKGKGRF